MIYSLNEIETLARKAARGAGLPWGIAEETGVAARWLAARQLPVSLMTVLQNRDMFASTTEMERAINESEFCASPLCPLMAGIFLCDRQPVCDGLIINNLAQPLWLAFFFSTSRNWTALRWSGTTLVVGRGQLYLSEQDQISAAVADVTFSKEKPTGVPVSVANYGCEQDEKEWCALESLAANCYVPASNESRRGAGE
ncbi:DUF3726 domain-containing protein [Candidatus Persebacteraceae bacterium Df01]|uniref:DUF3726 domain-containing protein n=1 Tax=Candidatus Doriopsillibacter californiensis TaxID=2970740 RepID=A0ABT7QNB7_9GAMM|nr:DUF3726 domain-containing protein [Candidatus Persebacteraceae bacterium Df01]